MKAIWLLDIDGVVNFFGVDSNPWDDDVMEAHVWASSGANGMAYPIRWSPSLIREILRIRDEYDVEVVLCSTWCGQATELLEAIGLPTLPEAFPASDGTKHVWALKATAFRDALAEGPVIWTDDDAIPYGAKLEENALCIVPNQYVGLTPEHIKQITDWLDEL